MELTQEIARELIDLDKESGIMTWRIRGYKWFKSKGDCMTWNRQNAGKEAFTIITESDSTGREYCKGSIFKRLYYKHRLIWFMVTGEWPNQIDHINGNSLNNSWANLRNVNNQENGKNAKRSKANKSGRIGVCWATKDNAWRASIGVSGKTRFLGNFKTFDEACDARAKAEKEHGFHPNHGKR